MFPVLPPAKLLGYQDLWFIELSFTQCCAWMPCVGWSSWKLVPITFHSVYSTLSALLIRVEWCIGMHTHTHTYTIAWKSTSDISTIKFIFTIVHHVFVLSSLVLYSLLLFLLLWFVSSVFSLLLSYYRHILDLKNISVVIVIAIISSMSISIIVIIRCYYTCLHVWQHVCMNMCETHCLGL